MQANDTTLTWVRQFYRAEPTYPTAAEVLSFVFVTCPKNDSTITIMRFGKQMMYRSSLVFFNVKYDPY